MMMGVDETRHHDMPREVEDFVGFGGQAGSGADLLDEAIANEKTTIGNFPLMVVHGEEMRVFD